MPELRHRLVLAAQAGIVTVRPASAPLRLPRTGPGTITRGVDFDNAMQQLEQADARTVKLGTTPAFPALILTAPDGGSWRVMVEDNGQLRTTAVAR